MRAGVELALEFVVLKTPAISGPRDRSTDSAAEQKMQRLAPAWHVRSRLAISPRSTRWMHWFALLLRAVDLLLADMVVPSGLSGIALVRMARLRQPKVQVILVTGYAVPEGEIHAWPVLPKPVSEKQLLAEVCRALKTNPPVPQVPNKPDAVS